MQSWRLVDLTAHNAFMNMAIDEAILKASIQQGKPQEGLQGKQQREWVGTIRFYTWTPAAISIGCMQKFSADFNLSQIEQLGLALVRRPTGGRAVLHGGDLTYSLVFAENNPIIPRGTMASYYKISQAIQRGLALLGLPAQLCPERKISRSAFCFAGKAKYEILLQGKKVMGSAQRRERGAVLQQGSIMVENQRELIQRIFSSPRLDELFSVEGASRDSRAEEVEFGSEFTSLEEVAGGPIAICLLKEALIRGIEEEFDICLARGPLTGWEKNESERLCQEKYSRPLWTIRGYRNE